MSWVTQGEGFTTVHLYEVACAGFLFFGTAEVRGSDVKFTALRKPGDGCLCSVLGLVDPSIMAELRTIVLDIIEHPSRYEVEPES